MPGDLKSTGHQAGGSFIFFRKSSAVAPSAAYLIVSAAGSGNLFINNEFFKHMNAGEEVRRELDPGAYKVEMHYVTGEVEVLSIQVAKGQAGKAVLTGPVPAQPPAISPTPSPAPEPVPVVVTDPLPVQVAAPRRPRENYATITAGFGAPVPVGLMKHFMAIGIYPGLQAGYALKAGPGRLHFGIVSGLVIEPPVEAIEGGYTMYSVPVALFCGYEVDFSGIFFLSGEAAGGVALNRFVYPDGSPAGDGFTPSLYTGITLDAGVNTGRNFSISVYGSFIGNIFANQVYLGAAPGVRCRLNFR